MPTRMKWFVFALLVLVQTIGTVGCFISIIKGYTLYGIFLLVFSTVYFCTRMGQWHDINYKTTINEPVHKRDTNSSL